MTISEFYERYNDEQSCRDHLKQSRELAGIVCKKCGCARQYWLKSKEQWQCKNCSFRTTLRSGTLFESSNLPIKLWYQALYLISNTKKAISACELQRQLGLKRNEPAWYMLHKIRKVMARINEQDQVDGNIDPDEAYFKTIDNHAIIPSKEKSKGAIGRRSQKALLLVESTNQQSRMPTGCIRMLAAKDLEDGIVWGLADQRLDRSRTEQFHAYRCKKILFPYKYYPAVVESSESLRTPSWVFTVISNIRRLIKGIYHHISTKFTQLYLDEFVFKFNYRYHKNKWGAVLQHSIQGDWYDCGES